MRDLNRMGPRVDWPQIRVRRPGLRPILNRTPALGSTWGRQDAHCLPRIR